MRCLESILQNGCNSDLEILVVDGASDDGTTSLLEEASRRWSCVSILANPGQTTPIALNIGIRRARGRIIMRMDAHCTYPNDYIDVLIHWLDESGADNVGGVCRTLPGSRTAVAGAIAAALSHPFGVGNSHFRIGATKPKWVDTVPFGCYRRDVFERIGLFDEELVKNQDDELNQRLLKNGGRILLVPEVTVDYYARDSIRKVARMYYQYGYFKPLVARKLKRVGTLRQIVPATFIGSLLISALLTPWLVVARWALVVILGSYLAALLTVILAVAPKRGVRLSALLGLVFPTIHFSYGWGSLRGMLRFLVGTDHLHMDAKEGLLSR